MLTNIIQKHTEGVLHSDAKRIFSRLPRITQTESLLTMPLLQQLRSKADYICTESYRFRSYDAPCAPRSPTGATQSTAKVTAVLGNVQRGGYAPRATAFLPPYFWRSAIASLAAPDGIVSRGLS